jgi:hypothetical protein
MLHVSRTAKDFIFSIYIILLLHDQVLVFVKKNCICNKGVNDNFINFKDLSTQS